MTNSNQGHSEQLLEKTFTVVFNLAAAYSYNEGNLSIHVVQGPVSDFNRNAADYLTVRYKGRTVLQATDNDITTYIPGQSRETELDRVHKIAVVKGPRR